MLHVGGCLWIPEEIIRSCEAGFTGGYEPSCLGV